MYVLLLWLLEFVALRARSIEFKQLEIIRRHELARACWRLRCEIRVVARRGLGDEKTQFA